MLNQKEAYAQEKLYFDLMIEELDRANGIITEYLGLARNKPDRMEPPFCAGLTCPLLQSM
ncbi:MAG: hypothetical protein ACM3QZ_01855 [Solirubrobacterales bacterium]